MRAVREPQREPGAAPLRTLRTSSRGPESAGIFSPCEPKALEDVIPLGSGNPSSAPLASTLPRPRISLFEMPCPSNSPRACCCHYPACPRSWSAPGSGCSRDIRYKVIIIEKTRKDGHGAGQLSARKAEVSADSRSVLPPSPHPCCLNR